MNNQEVLDLAKDCGLVHNHNHDILSFYQKLRSQMKKEFQSKYQYQGSEPVTECVED